MAIRYIKLPLFSDTFYSYNINLEGNKYTLEFLFIERVGDWFFSLKDSEQNTLVLNKRLTPQTGLVLDYRLANLTGFFFLSTKSGEDPERLKGDRRMLQKQYDFFYIYDDGE